MRKIIQTRPKLGISWVLGWIIGWILVWMSLSGCTNAQPIISVFVNTSNPPSPAEGPSISISNIVVGEAGGSAILTAQLSRTSTQETRLTWQTADDSAIAGIAYVQSSGVLTISAGSLSGSLSVPILDNSIFCQGDSVFMVKFSDAMNATLVTPQSSVNIVENDFPQISATVGSVVEGGVAEVVLSLSGACSNHEVNLNYTKADGTATAPADYVGSSGTITFPAGTTTKSMAITTFDNAIVTGPRTFSIGFSSPTYATLNTATVNITITDDDVATGSTNDVTSISAGPNHTCAIRSGAAYCWGINYEGELGTGLQLPSYTPVQVFGLSGGVTKISAGGLFSTHPDYNKFTCAIVSGAAKCWGYQDFMGQLGDGSVASSMIPVDVSGLGTNVTDLDSSEKFSCAVQSGTAKCWGYNGDGQLGIGNTTNQPTPAPIPSLGSTVQAIATGAGHACAISSGAVFCWGNNVYGQLGDNNLGVNSHIPVPVLGIDGSSGHIATKITAGRHNTCAIVSGSAVCWGRNHYGQLGDGTTIDRASPVNVVGLASGIQDISTGSDAWMDLASTCAIRSGDVYCWGENAQSGKVGDSSRTDRYSPVLVTGLLSNFVQVSVGAQSACAVASDGKSYCWGDWSSGQGGNNLARSMYKPQVPLGLSTGVTAVSAGNRYGCAIQEGALKCWGMNQYGNLGDNSVDDKGSPIQVDGLLSGVTEVSRGSSPAASNQHTCAVHNGGAKCWGDNGNGQLGNGSRGGQVNTPAFVNGLSSGVKSVDVSLGYSCAVLTSGGVQCWGYNGNGQLGNNSTVTSDTPVTVLGISNASEVRLANHHACAIDGGAMKCWGDNSQGQLGNNTTVDSLTPITPTGLGSGVTSIAVVSDGSLVNVSCAVVNGAAKCWGRGAWGMLGNGGNIDQYQPSQVSGFSSGVKKIYAGGYNACLLTTGGALHCWGSNSNFILTPNNSIKNSNIPIASVFAPSGVVDMALGIGAQVSGFACFVSQDSVAKCWGALGSMGLGRNDVYISAVPTEVLFP